MMNHVSAKAAPAAKIVPMETAQATTQTAPSLIDEKKLLDTARRLAESYLSGKSLVECAIAQGCDVGDVRFLLRISGVPVRRNQWYADSVKKQVINEYVNSDKPIRCIAAECGVSTATVYKWARNENVYRRTALGWPRYLSYQESVNQHSPSAPASPTLPELHDQTGEALISMQKMFAELTNRMAEMEKLLGAEKK